MILKLVGLDSPFLNPQRTSRESSAFDDTEIFRFASVFLRTSFFRKFHQNTKEITVCTPGTQRNERQEQQKKFPPINFL